MERHNGIEPDPEGAFVYYADHQQTVERLEQQVAQLREERDKLLDAEVELNARQFCEFAHEIALPGTRLPASPSDMISWGKFKEVVEALATAHTTLRGLVEKLHPSLLVAARNYITQCYCKDKNVPCTKHDAFYVEREHLEPLQQLLDSRTLPRDGGKAGGQ